MTRDPVCVDEDATVDDVIAAMDMRKVEQIPVMTGGQVIGIVNRHQLIAALERRLSRDEETVEAAT